MADCVNRKPNLSCPRDHLGRSMCAELIREAFASFESYVVVTPAPPPTETFGVSRYTCSHNISHWVQPAFSLRGER